MASFTADFRHVTIVHTRDGERWCEYFNKMFQKSNLRLRVDSLNVELLSYENPPELLVALQESYVTLMLMTAGLTDYMESESKWMTTTFNRCDHDVNTVLAVPFYVEMDDFINVCEEGKYDKSKWDIMELLLDGSNSNVQDIVSKALDWIDGNRTRRNEKVHKDDEFLSASGFCEMFPTSIQQVGQRIAVVFMCPIEGNVTMILRKKENQMKLINPYCAVCTIPEIPMGKHTVTIMVDGEVKAKLKLKYKPFTPDSLTSLMQTFNVSKKEELDNLLAQKYNESICNDPLLMRIEEDFSSSIESKKNTKYPTMIHWAAANGLKELCSQLLMSPGAVTTCSICNCDDRDAADLAGYHKNFELEEYINDFLDTKNYIDACGLYIHSQGADNIYEDMSMCPIGGSVKKPSEHKTLAAVGRSISKSEERLPPALPRKRQSSVKVQPSTPIETPVLQAPEVSLSGAAVGCRSQNELIDLMEDYKQGNFSMSEVEMLFMSWKERYKSGNAVSFKEKQSLLEDFRLNNKKYFASKRDNKIRGGKGCATLQEEVDAMPVSEPIVPRKTAIAPSSKRINNVSLRDSATSTASSSSSASYDSGRWSDQSVFSAQTLYEENNSNRKSSSQIFMEQQQDMSPPPVPPRPPLPRNRKP